MRTCTARNDGSTYELDIFGAAVEWSQEPGRRTSEQMAHDVLLVITEGIAHLFPDAFSE